MREPAKIAAAIGIARTLRDALADALERHRSTGWDEQVLHVELGRTVGALLRLQDDPPSSVERLVDSMRRVYTGLVGYTIPDAEDLVRELCPQAAVEVDTAGAAGGSLVQ